MTKDKSALWEGIKEPLRILVLAIIPFGIAWLGGINYEWAMIATAILRFIDKYLHQIGKQTNNKTFARGLTQF